LNFDSLDFTDVAAIILVSPTIPPALLCLARISIVLAGLAAEHGHALIVDEVFADFPLGPSADAVTAVAGRPSPSLVFSLGGYPVVRLAPSQAGLDRDHRDQTPWSAMRWRALS